MTASTDPETALHCPMCEYDLRGQIDPRCPECGYPFDWAELRDPTRRRHPYLFEHHPERNVSSFFVTLKNGLRPKKFWSTLYPTQPSSPPRLLIYFVLVCLTAFPAAAIIIVHGFYIDRASTVANRASYLRFLQGPNGKLAMAQLPGLTVQQAVDKFIPLPSFASFLQAARWKNELFALALCPGLTVIWLLFTAAAFMIFQWSMRRARVKSVHAWRCIVYSGDIIVWLNFAFAIAMAVGLFLESTRGVPPHVILNFLSLLMLPLTLFAFIGFIYRLIVAARRYLRFDHAIATVIATQIIVALATLIILVPFLY